jgi:hypothetical protein
MILQIRYARSGIGRVLAIVILGLLPVARAVAGDAEVISAPLRDRVGGGNIVTHLVGSPSKQIYAALRGVGARLGRMDSYGWRDLARAPTPHDFDAAMREAHRHGITPVILLEYEGSYQTLQPPQLVGSYDDWFAAGQAYAKRFRPDGEWGRENGISGWGVRVFTAINEPDVQASIPREAYRDALAGLADGVHSIDAALRVVPGGFATCNSHGDATLRGYGPAIADLLEDGRLDGIDLHTYYNAKWYPITRGREFSVQTCFDRIKQAMGLRREINFYATEFNVARDGDWQDPQLAARLFLTAFWDQVGVVRGDGRTSAMAMVLAWNLADTGRIEGPAYAMAASENPWRPDPRAMVLRTILELAGDMKLASIDPRGGLAVLEGENGQLIVWQNLPGWTDRPGTALQITLPDWARSAEVWAWNGLRRRLTAREGGKFVIDGLEQNQTYMIRLPRPKP